MKTWMETVDASRAARRECPRCGWKREQPESRDISIDSDRGVRGAIIPSIDDLHHSTEPEQGDQAGGIL